MVDSPVKILSMVIFLVLVSQASSQCPLSSISVSQFKTGAKVEGQTQWSVTVTNKCRCVQAAVTLDCTGFENIERTDPELMRVSGNNCIVNMGRPISQVPLKFKYVWNQQLPLKPVSAKIYSCP
ncbi:hypothetical protein VNO78_15893 [Psophocarpus tetragonolobus]|uniref:Uncharacterized protein n=1 Tax=Psophocarpus tetragonolobus TaxID=3891 RepID=A0AAN9SFD4_PSOTE